MRIFYASDSTPNAALRSNLWRRNLLGGLIALGHEVVEFDYDLNETFRRIEDPTFVAGNRPRVTTELLRQVRAAHAERPVDLFFSYFYDACVEPAGIDAIRALNIPTMNWYCNGSYQLHLVTEIAPHYDWCLVPERFRLEDYRRLGANPVYCQEAADPGAYRPTDGPYLHDAAFVGQCYGDRPARIAALLNAGIDVRVFGVGWDCPPDPNLGLGSFGGRLRRLARPLLGGPLGGTLRRLARVLRERPLVQPDAVVPPSVIGGVLSDEAMVETFCRTRVNIGLSTCGDTHLGGERILQVRLRDFEVPMSGGFYLVEHMDELAEFFTPGREIETYHSTEEMIDKTRFYLANDSAREAIRRAGMERARRDHTWRRRFEESFRMAGLA